MSSLRVRSHFLSHVRCRPAVQRTPDRQNGAMVAPPT
jgi:hypothetical protein